MKSEGSFKIVIGDGWRATAYGAQGLSTSPAGDRFDASGVRGSLDMLLDGASLMTRHDEDSPFFLMRDFLAAAQRLYEGEGVARISFYESPHELVLQRIADAVYITFYRSGPHPEVFVKDRRIPLELFLDGVMVSAKELFEAAVKLDLTAGEDPVVSWIHSAADRLARARERGGVEVETHPLEQEGVESTRFKKPRTDDGFSFGFRFLATSTDLLAPGKIVGTDLSALLFRGQLAVHARGRRRVLGQGYLFLQVEKLLASLRKLLSAWEEGRPVSVRLISEGLAAGVRLGADDSLVINLADQGDDDSIIVMNDLTPWEYADAVLGVARELRRLIVDISPGQRRNLRLESFAREVRALSAWSKEQRKGAVINPDVEPYRDQVHRRRREDDGSTLGEASRLTFNERWRIEAEGLDLMGTMLCEGMCLISARGFILGVETESGAVVWRRETDRSESRLALAGRDGVVRVSPSGLVEMIDIATGVQRWSANLAARSGGSPVVLCVDHGPVPGVVIVAEEERKLVALDLRTGEPRWRFTVPRGGRFALRRHGKLLYVSSNDAVLVAVDIEDGSLVWRFPERTRFSLPPAVEGELLVVPGGRYGKQEGKLFGLNALSGEPLWEHHLNGSALTSPISSGKTCLVPVRLGRRSDLVAIDMETGRERWRVPCDGWAESCALMALDDTFIVNAAGGTMRCFNAKDGAELWNTVLGPACSDDVPLSLRVTLRGGVLFVPADTIYVVRPENGEVVHSLGGDPPVPDIMQVDSSCAVFMAEESGHIAMYELVRRFSVVDGGI